MEDFPKNELRRITIFNYLYFLPFLIIFGLVFALSFAI